MFLLFDKKQYYIVKPLVFTVTRTPERHNSLLIKICWKTPQQIQTDLFEMWEGKRCI